MFPEVNLKQNNFNGGKYLKFERLTHVPIQVGLLGLFHNCMLEVLFLQTKMLDLNLMTDEEIEWLNSYHQEVWEKARK